MVEAPGLRQLLEAERQGVLATISARRAGWPFASVAPYAVTERAEPLLLFSELAEHTRNLRADSRASLLVQDSTALDDPQAGARVTLLGTLQPHSADEARAAYLARHPRAEAYFALGDFLLWLMHVEEARYVNGFGDMGWLSGERLHIALAR